MLTITSVLRLSPPFSPGSEQVGQSGPLIGQWSNVTYLQASPSRVELQAKPTTIHLQGADSANN